MPASESLARLQERFWRYVVAPTGVADARASLEIADPGAAPVSRWVAMPDEDGAIERLDVYANMYFFRLRDILAEDFEKVHDVIGDDRFHNLTTDYLLACTPNDPNIRNVGRRFPAFVADHALGQQIPWLGDLASFCWARLSIFDARDVEPLTLDELQALSAEAWTQLVLQTIPGSTVLELRHPIHEIFGAIAPGDVPEEVPEAATTLVIWRKGFRIYHRSVAGAERAALLSLLEGNTFATVCQHFSAGNDSIQGAARAAHQAMLGWVEDKLLRRVKEKEDKP
jgi:hypothetical protein